ncbi:MAG: GntR family transcriptional regulator [Spirochaetaceae bacterium]|nr:MAG: GntR family transcriptional regulator [Spirochaetaceae bacterium]
MDRHTIYRELFNRVVHGAYSPGTWLREDAIASQFGVSRTPVREALLQLAQDGLAEGLPKRGYRARGFTVDDLEEAYELRRVLELLALERAVSTLSIQSLQAIRSRIEAVADVPDAIEHAAIDSELHRLIVDASQSRRLIAMLGSLYRIMQSFRELGFEDGETRRQATGEHIALIEALASRDAARASRLLDDHIRQSKARVLRQVLSAPVTT